MTREYWCGACPKCDNDLYCYSDGSDEFCYVCEEESKEEVAE